MKRSAILLASLGLPLSSLHAQTVPLFINYQGRVTGGSGVPLGSTGTAPDFTAAPENRKVIFRLFDAQTGGVRLWSEEQTVTISLGEFSVLLGQGTVAVYNAVSESRPGLDSVFTGGGAVTPAGPLRYLEIVVDNGDGAFTPADLPITPRQRLTTGAYSFRAAVADTVPNSAITGASLAAGSVSAAKIAERTITFNQIANGGITNVNLANNLITADKIADGTIGAADLASGSVTAAKLGAGIGVWAENAGNVSRGTGFVGIGKAPAVPLDVAGNIAATGNITAGGAVTASSITTSGPFAATNITANGAMRARGGAPGSSGVNNNGFAFHGTGDNDSGMFSAADGQIDFYSNSFAKMSLFPSGNVGIGTGNALDRLHVGGGGAVRIDDGAGKYVRMYRAGDSFIMVANSTYHVSGISQISWNGDGNWNQSSDRTLKSEITDAEPVLNRLMQLPVRRFRWNDRAPDRPKSFGVIAQEVQPLFPDVVGSMLREGDAEKTMTVKYADFGLIAAKAVQELKQEKDAEVKALREENADLRARLAALEAGDKARDAKLAVIENLLHSAGKSAARTVSLKAGE